MTARGGLSVVAVLLAGACGGGTSKNESSLTAENFPARYASAFCELTSGCCEFAGGEPRRADCETDVMAEQRATATAAIRAGATFDAQAAERCLTELERRLSCDPDQLTPLEWFLPGCQPWRGTVPLGQSCRLSLECLPEGDAQVSCVEDQCRVVEALPTSSACDPHETTAVCTSGFSRCDPDTLRCEPLPRSGEPCTDACHVEARCLEGLCQELGTQGEACTLGSDCHGDVCLEGRCAPLLVGAHCAAPE